MFLLFIKLIEMSYARPQVENKSHGAQGVFNQQNDLFKGLCEIFSSLNFHFLVNNFGKNFLF